MSKLEETHNVSLASPTTSESKKPVNGHLARYRKVYQFFGFNHGYNFPLCEYRIITYPPFSVHKGGADQDVCVFQG